MIIFTINHDKTFILSGRSDTVNDEYISLNHCGLTPQEVERAINNYIANQSEERKEIKRLNKLIDELLIERNKYKEYYEKDFEMRNSGY